MTQREGLEEEDLGLGLMKNVEQRVWLTDHACVVVLNGGSYSQVTTQHTLSLYIFVAVHLRTGGC